MMTVNKMIVGFLVFLMLLSTLLMAQRKGKNTARWATPVKNSVLANLYKVNKNIYRSEQPEEEAKDFLDELGIKSILSLKQQNKDKDKLGKHHYYYYSVEMESEDIHTKEIVDALRDIKDAPKPLLVHCKHGSDRTGVVMAMYRIVFENWTKKEAIDEMQNGNFGFKIKYTNIINFIQEADIEKIKRKVKEE